MKKVREVFVVFIAFFLAAYFTNLFYRDLFIAPQQNKLLFFVWGFPCLYLLATCMKLLIMIIGRQYHKHNSFSIVRINSVSSFKFLFKKIGARRVIFMINVDNRERIVSGVFWKIPTSVLVYKDAFDRLRVFSIGNLLPKFIMILANLIVVAVLRYFIL